MAINFAQLLWQSYFIFRTIVSQVFRSGFYFQPKESVSVLNNVIHYLNRVKVLKVKFNKLNINYVGSEAWHQFQSYVAESRSTMITSHGIKIGF
jgi:hypothetical protein